MAETRARKLSEIPCYTISVVFGDARLRPEDGSPVTLLPQPVYLAEDVAPLLTALEKEMEALKKELSTRGGSQ